MKVKNILIIDQDINFQRELSSCLKKMHFAVQTAESSILMGKDEERESFDLIMINPLITEETFEGCLEKVKLKFKEIPFIIIANQKNYDVIVKSMQLGAVDYIIKPMNLGEMQILAHRINSLSKMAIQIKTTQDLYQSLLDTYEQQLKLSIVSASPEMIKVTDMISSIAPQERLNIFISGEAGVGKEAIARGIHALSKRRNHVFSILDCNSLTPILLESELFGHSRNAYTGVMEEKNGVLETTNGGILYLKEIDKLPLHVQAKLLQAIKSNKFKKLASDKVISMDVRLIASSQQDISEMLERKTFLSELFELVNGYQIDILPLRDRKEDVILLTNHFVRMYADIMQRTLPEIAHDVQKVLLAYEFPGNVTELKNMIRKAMLLSERTSLLLSLKDFPDLYFENTALSANANWKTSFQPLDILDETEKQWIIDALKFYNNNKTHVARALHITRQSLNRRMEKHHITPDNDN